MTGPLAPERLVPHNPGQLRRLLATERLRPKKALSQNFLTDSAALDAIVAAAELEPGDRVVEVGPGLGVLTRRLLAAGATVLAVELDPRLAAYLRRELDFTGSSSAIFYVSSGGVGAFTSTGSDDASLAGAFARNPNLRLFVGVNYFDLSAPFYATEFTLAHLNVSPEVRAHNITVSHYEAGQMAYADNQALVKLHADLARFVNGK